MNYHLTARASQTFLSALLTRQHLSQPKPAEFARLTGLTERSVLLALRELESGLASIIAQGVNGYGTNQVVANPVLATQVIHAIQVEALESQDQIEEEFGDTEESDPLTVCRLADEAGDRKAQMAALSAVWAEAFPLPEYEYSQIEPGDSFSKWLTKNGRKAEWVGNIIERVGQRGGYLEHPISYVRAIVEREERDRAKQTPNNEVGIEITDELRAMVLEGGRRFGNA